MIKEVRLDLSKPEQLAQVARALGSDIRIRILEMLDRQHHHGDLWRRCWTLLLTLSIFPSIPRLPVWESQAAETAVAGCPAAWLLFYQCVEFSGLRKGRSS